MVFVILWLATGFIFSLIFFYNMNVPKHLDLTDILVSAMASIFGIIIVPFVVWYCFPELWRGNKL